MNYLKPLLKIMQPVIFYMLSALILTVLTAFSAIGLLATGAYLIATAALHPPLYTLTLPILGVRCFGITRAVLRYGERYIAHDATFRILSRLRTTTYDRLEQSSPVKTQTKTSAELCDMLLHQVDTLKDFYLRILAPLSAAIIVAIFITLLIGYYLPKLALCLLAAFLLIGLVIPSLINYKNRLAQQQIEEYRLQLHNSFIDTIRGNAELTAFNRLPDFIAKIEKLTDDANNKKRYFFRRQALADTTTDICIALIIIIAFYFLTPLIAKHYFTGIQLAVLILVLQSTFELAFPLPAIWQYYATAIHSAKQLFSLPITKRQSTTIANPNNLPTDSMNVLAVNELYFAYSAELPVLKNITFNIKHGERIALVGANGSGKSTLMALLLNLYQPQQGTLQLKGINYTSYSPENIRNHFAVATQEMHLFQDTIRNNFAILHPHATEKQISSALNKAELTSFIKTLPQGLDTFIGHNGQSLSGGQRQRLILALALLKPTPIILLDEPTKGLDDVTADKIITTLLTLPKEQTLFLITHDLTALQKMDRIIVLEGGTIIECGTYSQLVEKQGAFFQLLTYCYH